MRHAIVLLVTGFMTWSCSGDGGAGPDAGEVPAASQEAAAQPRYPTLAELLPENVPWKGDLDGIIERRVFRILVAYNRTSYFIDQGREYGLAPDVFREFEKWFNERQGRGHLKVSVAFMPVSRDELLSALTQGLGDIAVANITVTPERSALVDFSDPLYDGAQEIVVTGPDAAPVASLEDLSGRTLYVRPSSSYRESLEALNADFSARGIAPVVIEPADENLETEDILEMVNAGLVEATIADKHLADFWAQILGGIKLHPDLVVRSGGRIAWAFRKNSPKLAAELNAFVKRTRKGTLLGNMLLKRYLKSTRFVGSATSAEDLERFNQTIGWFREYAAKYDFDWLMLAAQGYQESGLDQSVRSGAGAIGIMQLLPSTAADRNVGIPDIEKIDRNIEAGAKYMRFLANRYFDDPGISKVDQMLLSFAAYNAGPGRVRQLRAEAEKSGLDPNKWFDNVERIAARRIGRETVQYVSNIYKYYIAYHLAVKQMEKKGVRVG